MAKPIRLTGHAKMKVVFLQEHGFHVEESDVLQTITEPDHIDPTRLNRTVAQRALSDRHVLRVVYEDLPHERVIITCYPARRSRYESAHEV